MMQKFAIWDRIEEADRETIQAAKDLVTAIGELMQVTADGLDAYLEYRADPVPLKLKDWEDRKAAVEVAEANVTALADALDDIL